MENVNAEYEVDKASLIINEGKKEVVIWALTWIFSLTAIGVPIIYISICYRGFCFGYTVSSFLAVLGLKRGVEISLLSLFLQNLIYIPCIILVSAKGLNLYKLMIKENKKIKIYINKLMIVLIIGLIGIILSIMIKAYISTDLLYFFREIYI